MQLKPEFLPVGSIVEYNIESINHPEWVPTKLDAVDLQWLDGDPEAFNIAHRPIPLTEKILTEWCGFEVCDEEKSGHLYWHKNNKAICCYWDGVQWCFKYGYDADLVFAACEYLHEVQLLFAGMKQPLPIQIK